MRLKGGEAVRKACIAFVKELKDDVMKGVQAPQPKAAPRERFNAGYVSAASESSKTSKIKVTYQYNPPPPMIYETLLDTQVRLHNEMCHSSSTLDGQPLPPHRPSPTTSIHKAPSSFVAPCPDSAPPAQFMQRIRGLTASDATMSTEVGGKISMFSGAVEGENLALTPFNGEEAMIKWKWRFSTWQPNMWSTVTITMQKQVILVVMGGGGDEKLG